jgi:hypothetical protein
MNNTKVYALEYRVLHDLYLKKVVRKDRTEKELLQVIEWLTGYSSSQVKEILNTDLDLKSFIELSPKLNPNRKLVSGKICGIQVEAMEEGLMKEIRIMDKVVDELAKGKSLEKILR